MVSQLSPGMLPSSQFGGPRTTKLTIHTMWPLTTIAFLTVGLVLLLSGSVLHGHTARGIGLVGAAASTVSRSSRWDWGLPTRDPLDSCSATPAPPCSPVIAALAWWGVL